MGKPTGLIATTAAMSFLNLSGYLFVHWGSKTARFELLLDTLFIAIGYLVLAFYWQGKNWARVLVMLTSLLAVFNLHLFFHVSLIQQLALIGEALLGVFLLYWLNTPEAKHYFKTSRSEPNLPN